MGRIQDLLNNDILAKELVEEATRAYAENSREKEMQRLKAQIYGCNSQLEALAERISELPKSASAKTFYVQMEKVEKAKGEYEAKIRDLEAQSPMLEKPAALRDYKAFRLLLKDFFSDADKAIQAEIIKRLIGKIEVGGDFVRIHYHTTELHTQYELNNFKDALKESNANRRYAHQPNQGEGDNFADFFARDSSNSLTNGASGRNRTGTTR